MKATIWIGLLAFALCTLSALDVRAASQSAPQILEPGFRITHFDQCGYQGNPHDGPPYTRRDRGNIYDIECSPGGDWGEYAYLAVNSVDQDFDPIGLIERVSYTGKSEVRFQTWKHLNIPEISFTPSAWQGGGVLLVTTNPVWGGGALSRLSGIDPFGPATQFAFRFDSYIWSSAVDPTGAFNSDLFFQAAGEAAPGIPPRPAGIYRIDATGVESLWSSLRYGPMRFGPGGAWGSDLFVDGVILAPAGTATPFPVHFTGFAWVDGPGFGGDMFARIEGDPTGSIWRVKPDGTSTGFAQSTDGFGPFVGCGGALWIANQDGCFVVESKSKR